MSVQVGEESSPEAALVASSTTNSMKSSAACLHHQFSRHRPTASVARVLLAAQRVIRMTTRSPANKPYDGGCIFTDWIGSINRNDNPLQRFHPVSAQARLIGCNVLGFHLVEPTWVSVKESFGTGWQTCRHRLVLIQDGLGQLQGNRAILGMCCQLAGLTLKCKQGRSAASQDRCRQNHFHLRKALPTRASDSGGR